MADKKTHFGRAGEFFAMSELLLRGWNVAVPVVDVGDDVFVIDDNDKTTWRLQVKSSKCERLPAGDGVRAKFTLSRAQLRTAQPVELFYMLMVRLDARWRFLVIPRTDLLGIRDAYVDATDTREARGRKPLGDAAAKVDALALEIVLKGDDVRGWDAPLADYLDRWPDALAPVTGGPGAVGRALAAAPAAAATPAAAPAPSPRREK